MEIESFMKLEIDLKERRVAAIGENGEREEHDFASPAGFGLISHAWLQSGWDAKHVYSFSWMGRPIIQLPEDLVRLQEVISSVKPNVIVETGIAHGGSLVYSASLLRVLHPEGPRKVIGVDIEIRPHNRQAIEDHFLYDDITLIEGNAVAPEVVAQVQELIPPDASVMVVLDSCHTREHVLAELRQYSALVSPGSYIVATDGIMKDLVGAPRAEADWSQDNPYEAVKDFLRETDEFVEEEPAWAFNESEGLSERITYWPAAYLRRK